MEIHQGDMQDVDFAPLVGDYEGKQFLGPNSLCFDGNVLNPKPQKVRGNPKPQNFERIRGGLTPENIETSKETQNSPTTPKRFEVTRRIPRPEP